MGAHKQQNPLGNRFSQWVVLDSWGRVRLRLTETTRREARSVSALALKERSRNLRAYHRLQLPPRIASTIDDFPVLKLRHIAKALGVEKQELPLNWPLRAKLKPEIARPRCPLCGAPLERPVPETHEHLTEQLPGERLSKSGGGQ